MGVPRPVERESLRAAAVFLDRQRSAIEAEVDRRLGRAQPPPEVRAEVVRRFRSYCRLASVYTRVAQPSLEGLGAVSATALERTVTTAVDAALLCGAPQDVARSLRELETRFRAGIRRVMRPEEAAAPGRDRRQRGRRRVRAAIDRIGDAYIALCLETGRVCDLNPAACALFGAEAHDLLERDFGELIHAAERASYRQLESRLDAGELPPPLEITATRLDGEPIPVAISVSSHTIAGRRLAILIAREQGGARA